MDKFMQNLAKTSIFHRKVKFKIAEEHMFDKVQIEPEPYQTRSFCIILVTPAPVKLSGSAAVTYSK
jgi:hypothetical protein